MPPDAPAVSGGPHGLKSRALNSPDNDPVLQLATTIEEKERATEGLDMVAAAKIEAELATLYSYGEMAIPTSAEGAAIKLRRSADFIADDFHDEGCAEPAEALLLQMAEQAIHDQLRPFDLTVLRFMEAVLRKLNENSPAANLIGSTLQWLARPKLV
ncbi:MAG: hypothetical protein WAL02_02810 [Rhodoplanes sp.]